jgi:SAM-dependent methyltransferase
LLPQAKRLLKGAIRRARVASELLVWGGERRERVLLGLLGGYYSSLFRRQWKYGAEEPHFFSHRINAFRFGFADGGARPESFYRGFFCSEVIREGDRVLDIGCGDGFFTKRFLSPRAQTIDAVDIEPAAIRDCLQFNRAPNITYRELDAVKNPFPQPAYDVVIWDGAIGHFAEKDTAAMMTKISAALSPSGVFAGSESLGHEGSDHLQFFETLEDLGRLLTRYWRYVLLRETTYSLDGSFVRREAFWRCSNDLARLNDAGWVAMRAKADERPAGAGVGATV